MKREYNTYLSGYIMPHIEITCVRRIYDRRLPNPRYIPTNSRFLERMKVLFGITGFRRARYRETWTRVIIAPLNVAWRPHLFFILLFEVC